MAERLDEAGADAKVEVVVPADGGRPRLSVDKLGALDEPASLTWLRETTAAMLPPIDLPDLLFEVHAWTGFLHAFTHVSTNTARMDGLLTSLVAVLVSEACNVGLTPVINPNLVELTRARLSHVDQNYLRVDTIAAANALLIEAQSRVELAQLWGGGLLASVDGLRFVVPSRTINAAPHQNSSATNEALPGSTPSMTRSPGSAPWLYRVSAYDLMCRSWYGLTCRGQAGRSCHVRVLSSNRGEPMF
jgi:hypothetical protein